MDSVSAVDVSSNLSVAAADDDNDDIVLEKVRQYQYRRLNTLSDEVNAEYFFGQLMKNIVMILYRNWKGQREMIKKKNPEPVLLVIMVLIMMSKNKNPKPLLLMIMTRSIQLIQLI